MLDIEAEKLEDDEDRFYSHLATYLVVALMAVLLSISSSLPPTWIVAAFLAWGTLLACHGLEVFTKPREPAQPAMKASLRASQRTTSSVETTPITRPLAATTGR